MLGLISSSEHTEASHMWPSWESYAVSLVNISEETEHRTAADIEPHVPSASQTYSDFISYNFMNF